MLKIKLKKYFSYSLILLILLLFSGYTLHHFYNGSLGYEKNSQLNNQLEQLKTELEDMKNKEVQLKKNINLLKNNIDADMLQEQAKKILYYADPNEIIIKRSYN
tara:strand:+ start:9455 stop:9766 length:312 start_codon:yes stop_codon:yes gene_type:complete